LRFHLSIWFIAAALVGIVAWVATSGDLSFNEAINYSSETHNTNSDAIMSDRDNAAEEVRAVATKITNLEQMIQTQHTFNESEREKIKLHLNESVQHVLQTATANDDEISNEQIINTLNEVSNRLEQIEYRQESVIHEPLPAQSATQQFVWYDSSDNDSDFVFEHQLSESAFVASEIPISNATLHNTQLHYTIPPTTTLLHATAMTALVGRIPVNGRLQDPWRFKVIIGAANLAANGHSIPQLAGMLWAGTARGDFSLSCVSGNIDTATFIFADGSIQTTRVNASSDDGTTTGLGWISDEFGNPCIAGDLKSNAIQYLTQATLVNTAHATADAISNAQTQSQFNPTTGETSTSITGDIDKYVAGYAARESLSEVSKWLAERQLTSFDAIYIPAGKKVAIHIEEPILIDHDPAGRRIRYFDEHAPTFSASQGRID